VQPGMQQTHNSSLLETPNHLCPGPHRGPVLPPVSREVFGGTALCPDCGTVSRICPRTECGGRTRAGGFFCRVCAEPLPAPWRNGFWTELDRDVDLAAPAPVVARTLSAREVGRAERIHLAATDAWIALSLDERLLLLEPGPRLATFCEHRLEPGELFVDLRRSGDDPPGWRLLTTRQVLRLEPRGLVWLPVERFQEGELLWESGALHALYRPGAGSSLWLRSPLRKLIEVRGLLSQPAWLPQGRFVCTDDENVYLGSVREPGSPKPFRASEPLSSHAPVFEPRTERIYLPGERKLLWWQPGAKSFIPFLPSGAGAVLLSPQGVILLEADRLQFLRPDARRLWDSRTAMSDFARSSLHWDRAGSALLMPLAQRGAAVPLLLMDLQSPGRVWRTELAAVPPSEPRLAPGGIVAVQRRDEEGPIDLVWLPVSCRSSSDG
jgi:hypothetical protein